MTENVPLRLNEAALRKARHAAVQKDQSLSAWVADLVARVTAEQDRKKGARASALRRLQKSLRLGGCPFRGKAPICVDQIFVDTNILVYAHDLDAGKKHRIARDRISGLWRRDLLLSIGVHVLQEFYVNLIEKKIPVPLARETVTNHLEWEVIDKDRSLFLEGLRWKERWRLSYWDGTILAAAHRAKAKEVWSEDLNPDQEYNDIKVVNPLTL